MEAAVGDEPVVVLSIDQIVSLGAGVILCRVEEVSDSVRLFANVIAVVYQLALVIIYLASRSVLLSRQLFEMLSRKAHRLCSRKIGLLSSQKLGNFFSHCVEKLSFGLDARLGNRLDRPISWWLLHDPRSGRRHADSSSNTGAGNFRYRRTRSAVI